MYDFFVLGLIPGTDIQITFTMWLEALLLVICSLYLVHIHVNKHAVLAPTIGPETIKTTLLARRAQLIRRIAAALPISTAGSR
jgi:hypothetical protein